MSNELRMNAEILWNYDVTRDFLADLKNFAQSLNSYQIVFKLDKPEEKKYVVIKDESYNISSESANESFHCPNCQHQKFDVMEGIFQDKPVLGLACDECNTYGAIFLKGL